MTNTYDPMNPQGMNVPPKKSKAPILIFGCLGILLVCILLCAGGLWWAWAKGAAFLADTARTAMVQKINESDLSEETKKGLITQIDRVVDGYKSGKISNEQLVRVLEELGKSPVFETMPVLVIEHGYLPHSGLSDEEKEQGKITVGRAARGIFEGKISFPEVEKALKPIAEESDEDTVTFKSPVTDEELRETLKQLKQLADDAGIPDERYEVDLAGELKKSVDKALGEN